MKLSHALRIEKPVAAALVGSGGKTTALFQLARQLSPPVIVTTSTHLGIEEAALADQHIILKAEDSVGEFLDTLTGAVVLISGPMGSDQRIHGLPLNVLREIHQIAKSSGLSLLVEADGSKRLPLKAPGAHEPVIPDWSEVVIISVGLQALGKPLTGEFIHRPEIFSHLCKAPIGSPISIAHIQAVLMHPNGGLKNIPGKARKIALLNQADSPQLQEAATATAYSLLSHFDSVVISALIRGQEGVLSVHEKVAGIILAAGKSSRFGQPKILLDWHGIPVIRHEAITAIEAGLSPVIVVLGAVIDPAVKALERLPVEIVMNERWADGQSKSVQAGTAALPPETGAAVFLLGDQPHVSVEVIKALRKAHSISLAPIIAPYVMEQRANPVLFDRATFHDLLSVQGDQGGRALFTKYMVHKMPWQDQSLLLDIDSPEDYSRLLEMHPRE